MTINRHCRILSEQIISIAAPEGRCSSGQINQVVERVLETPPMIDGLFDVFLNRDGMLRQRVVDVLEKVSITRSDLLQSRAGLLVDIAEQEAQHVVRWHLAQIIPRLRLTRRQKERSVQVFFSYLRDDKSISVRTHAMEGLFRLAQGDRSLFNKVRAIIRERAVQGTPAERARARILLAKS